MITVTDLFAGAGGSSEGATEAGADVVIAANHWDLAVRVHQDNFPDVDHDCADISQVDPRRYPHTDILHASPECTHHSNAAGKHRDGDWHGPNLFDERPMPVEAYERSRATMWDVPRFAEFHRYPVVLVENVVEATNWAPFGAWLQAMASLGYAHEVICHNAMHAQAEGLPAPQSRDRLFVAFWDRRMPRPDWDRVQRPKAWCPRCDATVHAAKAWKRPGNRIGKYRTQYVYACTRCGTTVEPGWLPASTAIDWTVPAQRIGDRSRPLAPKTMARIRAGLKRWAELGGEPRMLVPVEGRPGKKAQPVDLVHRTMTTRCETGLLMPYYGASTTLTPDSQPLGTVTTRDRFGLIVPMRNNGRSHTTDDPLGTIAAGGNHHGLIPKPAPDAEDCGFRMLQPHEYAAGMAFPDTYQWLGTKRERVKLAGNAVCPPMERDLVAVAIDALAGVA